MRSGLGRIIGAAATCAALAACGDQADLETPVASGGATSAVQVPIAFEADGGRSGGRARFVARGPGGAMLLGDEGPAFALGNARRSSTVRFELPRARPGLRPVAGRRLEGVVNSFVGPRSRWRTGLPTFASVRYPRVWNGIDLVFHGRRDQLEYDFVLAPGADPRRITIEVRGGRPRLDERGRLFVKTRGGRFVQQRPRIFQPGGDRVRGRFAVEGRTVRFVIGAYDRTRPLIIDPVIVYSTFNGGAGADLGADVAVGPDGAAVVAGRAAAGFPLVGAADSTAAGDEAFVTKLAPDGRSRVFSTYLGGGQSDAATAVDVDPASRVAVTGQTTSADFPVTSGALLTSAPGGQDAFVTTLSATGQLIASTYLGGTGADAGQAVSLPPGGGVDVAGVLTNTAPRSTGADAFWARLDAALTTSTLTRVAGAGSDRATGLDHLSDGRVVIAGTTDSTDLATVNAPQAAYGGGTLDAFVAAFAPASPFARSLVTYHGGSEEERTPDVAVRADDGIVVTGTTTSADLPLAAPLDSSLTGANDGFLARFTAAGAREVSSYIGGEGNDTVNGVAVAADGTTWVAGSEGDLRTGLDAVVWRVAASQSQVLDTTRLGGAGNDTAFGVATDSLGHAYVAGVTDSNDFPTLNPVQPTNAGSTDAFLTRLHEPTPTPTPTPSPSATATPTATATASATATPTAGATGTATASPTAVAIQTAVPTPTVEPVLPPVLASADDDGDGVRNAADACPRTVPGDRLLLRGCAAAELLADDDALPRAVGDGAASLRNDVRQLGWLKSRKPAARLRDVRQAFASAQARLVAGDGCGAAEAARTGREAAKSAAGALLAGIQRQERDFRRRRPTTELDPTHVESVLVQNDLDEMAAAGAQAAGALRSLCESIEGADRTVAGTVSSIDALHNRVVIDGVLVSIAGSTGADLIAPGSELTVHGVMLEGGVLAAEVINQAAVPKTPDLADCVTPQFVPRTAVDTTPGAPLLTFELAGYDVGSFFALEEAMGVSARVDPECPFPAPGMGFFRYGVTVVASWKRNGVEHKNEVLASTFTGEPLPAFIPGTEAGKKGVIQFVEWRAHCVASETECSPPEELDRQSKSFESRGAGGYARLQLGGGLGNHVYAVPDLKNRSDVSGLIAGWNPAKNAYFDSGVVEAFGRTVTEGKKGPVGPIYKGHRVAIVDDPRGGIEAARVFGSRNGSGFVYDAERPTVITDGIRKCKGSGKFVYLRLPWVQRNDWEEVTQGYFGKFTHDNDYALDLVMEKDEPIHAARGGKVIRVTEWRTATSDPQAVEDGEEAFAEANELIIKHRDGTTATYAHMPKNGIVVSEKDVVRRGQRVARVGNTGNSTGPHLHIQLSNDARWEYRREDKKFIGCGIPKGESDVKTTNDAP